MILDGHKTWGGGPTNPTQKQKLLEYILKKLDVSESQLSKTELAELQKTISKFFSTFCTKYSGSNVSRTISRLGSDRWCSGQLNLPETIVTRLTVNSFTLQEINTKLQHQENISFSHNELFTVMKDNLDCDFTDALKQTQALKEYMLKKLSLDEEEIFEGMEEFEEKIKNFVLKACSKYKKSNRMFQRLIQAVAKDSKSKLFELPNSIINIIEEHRSQTWQTKQNVPILEKLRPGPNEMTGAHPNQESKSSGLKKTMANQQEHLKVMRSLNRQAHKALKSLLLQKNKNL